MSIESIIRQFANVNENLKYEHIGLGEHLHNCCVYLLIDCECEGEKLGEQFMIEPKNKLS
jgi:hypothetical protein